MESIKEIYRIGFGPSSSHTMGPAKAASIFAEKYNSAASFRVTLYGSLAATGKGHQTDAAIYRALHPKKVKIIWQPEVNLPKHPNGMKFEALDVHHNVIGEWIVYSIGGGKITDFSNGMDEEKVYDYSTMDDILKWTKKTGKSFWEYVEICEGEEIYNHIKEVWDVMNNEIDRGINNEGIIPGGLRLSRKASSYYIKAKNSSVALKDKSLVFSYALAASEENASGGMIVTAPTCGSCGVLPAVLRSLKDNFDFSNQKMYRAIATAGLIGNIVKENA